MGLVIHSLSGYQVHLRYKMLLEVIIPIGEFTAYDIIGKLDIPQGTIYGMLRILKKEGVIENIRTIPTRGGHHKVYKWINKE